MHDCQSSKPSPRLPWIQFALLGWMLLAGCSPKSASKEAIDRSPTSVNAKALQPLTISAAASTKEFMNALVDEFEKSSSGEIKVNFAASSTLANQILSGAPVDLFLSANQQWANELEKTGMATEQFSLFTNRLVMVVLESNPSAIHTPQDLSKPSVKKIALAGEHVPAGIYANQVLNKLQLLDELVGVNKIVRGQDVRTALSFVERGEAEAGIVYSTDALIASGIKVVHEFDPTLHDPIVYVLVKLRECDSNERANDFCDFVRSPAASDIGTRFGFIPLDRNNQGSK